MATEPKSNSPELPDTDPVLYIYNISKGSYSAESPTTVKEPHKLFSKEYLNKLQTFLDDESIWVFQSSFSPNSAHITIGSSGPVSPTEYPLVFIYNTNRKESPQTSHCPSEDKGPDQGLLQEYIDTLKLYLDDEPFSVMHSNYSPDSAHITVDFS
ncbi:hypothetical protein AJ79_09921 [Helicocarpus griseus UAMH5409]|uniref:Uncharacterized protein n=1 Tax=Helicocarpus griseus UAMH5409 TaxID=1447875 RepID=A0A2B7WGI0_9EURO|nr:hypothetical protein AJ79_09921 [Helicocarpus griseus UAMH5409]